MRRPRLTRARALFALHVVGIVVLLVVGTKLLSLGAVQSWGEDAYRDGAADVSRDRWGSLLGGNLVEPDVAHFDLGLAEYASGDFPAARARFEQALADAPAERRCSARRNLVLTLEAYAATLGRAQDELDKERLLRRALRTIDAAPECLRRGARDGESARELRAARDRITRRKLDAPAAGDQASQTPRDERSPYGVPAPAAQASVQQLQRSAELNRSVAAQQARTDTTNPGTLDDPKR